MEITEKHFEVRVQGTKWVLINIDCILRYHWGTVADDLAPQLFQVQNRATPYKCKILLDSIITAKTRSN